MPDAPDDVALLRDTASGDTRALAELYRRHAAGLFGFLCHLAGDRTVAEEILQDTMLAVWRSSAHFGGRSSVRTWLYGVARRQAHNRLRSRPAAATRLDDLPEPTTPEPRPRPVARPAWRRAPLLLRAQTRLVGRSVWIASALVMALGALLTIGWTGTGPTVLALVAPVVAAGGVAGLYSPARDPGYELAASTPTQPRLILLARLTLVVGYDVALALLASAALVLFGQDTGGLLPLVDAWLGPLALLAALSLVLGVRFDPDVATAGALTLWTIRIVDGSQLGAAIQVVTEPVAALWTTRPLTLAIAAVLGCGALVLAGRFETRPARR